MTIEGKTEKEYNKLKIIGWSIDVKWSDGTEEKLSDCDDTTASYVDDYLTEKETEKNQQARNK